MAECVRFVCAGCGHSILAWSDGNPFYVDAGGKKIYAYHPNHDELEKCIANDVPHLCLECGAESKIDSRIDPQVCSDCGSGSIVDLYTLDGVNCTKCKSGSFGRDMDFDCIS
jgi:DNA-directed RNA polymerase subunit RPC12/RpoP